MLRKILLSNLVVAGLMFVPGSAIALTLNTANSSLSGLQSTNSGLLVAEVDADALNEAANAMEKAASAMTATESAKSVEQIQQHFATALSSMEEAAGLLEKAGVPDGAIAMNRAIASVRGAVNAESDTEADKLMKDAEKALSDVITAVEKAAN
ncbi:hypothetical protein [Brunnivagina elsteri]|uniref:Uncharacterized protein n=1 Tax=Brunnivagina elsteri CCALA 953 TaxID=987040 RepID=A0A2A2TAD4_9CYAN|nr:hypothetical protein [Calothrix elsteri]PAX47075.1 hypothetical protein CK510_28920 [Calothrix elsteri CCALA 953]